MRQFFAGRWRSLSGPLAFVAGTALYAPFRLLPEADWSGAKKVGRPFSGGHSCFLFDDLVGASEQRLRNRETKRISGPQIEGQFELRRLLYW
jgi:hypothetical protein